MVSWRDTIQEEDSEESYEIDKISPKVYCEKQVRSIPTILLKKNKGTKKKVKKAKFRSSLLHSSNESGLPTTRSVPDQIKTSPKPSSFVQNRRTRMSADCQTGPIANLKRL